MRLVVFVFNLLMVFVLITGVRGGLMVDYD